MARRVQGRRGPCRPCSPRRGRISRGWAPRHGAPAAPPRRLAAAGARGLIAAVAYGLYSLVKGVWGGSLEEGRRAAASLIDLEKSLGIYVEPDLQRFFVDHHLGMPFWNAFYVVSQVVSCCR